MLKGYSLQALYTPDNPTSSELLQKPREEPPEHMTQYIIYPICKWHFFDTSLPLTQKAT